MLGASPTHPDAHGTQLIDQQFSLYLSREEVLTVRSPVHVTLEPSFAVELLRGTLRHQHVHARHAALEDAVGGGRAVQVLLHLVVWCAGLRLQIRTTAVVAFARRNM